MLQTIDTTSSAMSTPDVVNHAASDADARSKDATPSRIRRRNRMITSCLECRRRKLKCDKLHPCTNCNKFSRDCMFLAPALDAVSQKRLNEIKDKMGSLEKVLEHDIARKITASPTSPPTSTCLRHDRRTSVDLPGEDSQSDQEAVPDDEKPLEVTPMMTFDSAYEDGGNDDVLDVGIRLGKVRITERLGGMFRPKIAEEMAEVLGVPIHKDFNDPNVRKLPDHHNFMSPGPTYIAPGSGFIFNDVGPRGNLVDLLPSKSAADTLVQYYYKNCHFVARALHWPSFKLQYEQFWHDILSGVEPAASLQAVVFAVMFSAVTSMREEETVNIFGTFGGEQPTTITTFQTATEVTLAKANILRSTRLETLQALVIYLLAMCRDVLSRAHSVLVGTAIRLAECMGLHRDPVEFLGASPVESHVRRILWFQLCFLDFKTAEFQGPRPYIKREDYDTKFPVNANDVDLMLGLDNDSDSTWTDMTLCRMRFECTEMWRIIRVDIERLHNKKISITHTVGKVESFRHAMESKYHPILDMNVAAHRFTKHLLAINMLRMHVHILHRYHSNLSAQLPDRLTQILIGSCTQIGENAMVLLTDPEFEDWRWYVPALHWWTTALILLIEVYQYPQRHDLKRIWRILDYVFSPDMSLPPDQKARQILSAFRDRTAFYRDIRNFKALPSMEGQDLRQLSIRRAASSETANSDGSRNRPQTPSKRLQTVPEAGQPQSSPSSKQEGQSGNNVGWTFGESWTSFVPATKPKSSSNSAPRSRTTSLSPAAMPASGLENNNNNNTKSSAMHDILSGLDHGASPSGSSTTTEAWPPPISGEQDGWRLVYQHSQAQPQGQHVKIEPAEQQRLTSVSSGPANGATRVQPSAPPRMGRLGNPYAPQGPASAQLPFISGGFEDVPNRVPGHHGPPVTNTGAPAGGAPQDDVMALDIDWAEWDKIFPPDVSSAMTEQQSFQARS